MVRSQKGFTIIELVVVIVILGILAAVAFPKFQDLSGDAKTAVLNGAAAAVKSAAVISYAKNQGTRVSTASVSANVNLENVTISGTCPGLLTLTYTGGSPTMTVDVSEYCSG